MAFTPAFSITPPFSRYFPIKTGFEFSLKSDKGNQMLFKSSIEIPDEAREMGHVFVNWHMFWKNNEDLIKYRFRFRVAENGVFYLVDIHDGIYLRSIPEAIPLISNNPKMNQEIPLGENMSLMYTRTYSRIVIGGKTFENVIQARLSLADMIIDLYFASGKGIIAIKSRDEVFVASS